MAQSAQRTRGCHQTGLTSPNPPRKSVAISGNDRRGLEMKRYQDSDFRAIWPGGASHLVVERDEGIIPVQYLLIASEVRRYETDSWQTLARDRPETHLVGMP
jgi:hypothetical protein